MLRGTSEYVRKLAPIVIAMATCSGCTLPAATILPSAVGGAPVVVDRLREMVQLASGLGKNGRLTREARQRAIDCLRRFGERVSHMPADAVRVVGTNPLRSARDAEEFLNALDVRLGVPYGRGSRGARCTSASRPPEQTAHDLEQAAQEGAAAPIPLRNALDDLEPFAEGHDEERTDDVAGRVSEVERIPVQRPSQRLAHPGPHRIE